MPFKTNASNPNIRWNYQVIAADARDTSTHVLLDDLAQARVTTRGDGNKLFHKPEVQACLEKVRGHMEWLAIEIHHGALTLIDFKENRTEMFLNREFVNELDAHGIGPAMLALFLPNFDACLLHASALVRHGRTAVFLAADEGGKTTAARLSPEGTILGDDQVLVRRDRDGFQVSGTPWGLHMDGKLRAPLAGLFLLEKAPRFSLRPLSARELLPYLWQGTKELLAILPKPLKIKAFEIVCELAAAVPAAKISFPKNFIAWEAIDKIMAG